MLIREVAGADTEAARLAALSAYLIGRNRDTNNTSPTSIDSFVKMAHNMGISLSDQQLRDIAQKPPLNGFIKNVTDADVIFKRDGGAEEAPTMTVDKAKKTVDTMAKRAASKKGK